ncbi:hypothetical protein [Micromonospora humida]|uniref:hypothetical protein n=1 Tax=Micromonospora humida TaxID=2809018 RepID=UPI0033FF001B
MWPEFLAAAPFLALSSWDTEGDSDTSPRGDRGTVVRVLDGRTLVLPDRRGNKRADTLHSGSPSPRSFPAAAGCCTYAGAAW